MSRLTAVEARQIAEKLEAEIKRKEKHDWVVIRWQGAVIAQYGIRRSSKAVGHDYIPRQIFVSAHQALELARCPLSRDQYFEIVKAQGKLPAR